MTTPTGFNVPSAKNLTIEGAVRLFVPTGRFWEILESDVDHLLLGTRGSGKTFLLKMMSLQHLIPLSRLSERAKVVLEQSQRYGIYIPMALDWCVAFSDEREGAARRFRDGVNMACCHAVVDGLRALLNSGLVATDSRPIEREIAEHLADLWLRKSSHKIYSLIALRRFLDRQEVVFKDLWRGPTEPSRQLEDDSGYCFLSAPLFAPFKSACVAINEHLGLRADKKWLLCLDELEVLTKSQRVEVNTAIRAGASNVVYKLATIPYTFEQTETAFSTDATAVRLRDLTPKRIQYDPASREYEQLVATLTARMLDEESLPPRDLVRTVFGTSTFMERAVKTDPSSTQASLAERGGELAGDTGRNKRPVLALRILKKAREGHTRSIAYSGWDTLLRVSDGNPGLFSRLLEELRLKRRNGVVSAEDQHEVLSDLSAQFHDWSRAIYGNADRLHKLIEQMGSHFSDNLHDEAKDGKLHEEVSRFPTDLQNLSDEDREALIWGARHALLIGESPGGLDEYPRAEGTWRLSYVLAPKFWLLPRRGRQGPRFYGLDRLGVVRPPETQLGLGFPDDSAAVVEDSPLEEI